MNAPQGRHRGSLPSHAFAVLLLLAGVVTFAALSSMTAERSVSFDKATRNVANARKVHKNVAYDRYEHTKFDLYEAHECPAQGCPLVISFQ